MLLSLICVWGGRCFELLCCCVASWYACLSCLDLLLLLYLSSRFDCWWALLSMFVCLCLYSLLLRSLFLIFLFNAIRFLFCFRRVCRVLVACLIYVVLLSCVSRDCCFGWCFPCVDFVCVLMLYCYCLCFVASAALRVFLLSYCVCVCLLLLVLLCSWSVCVSNLDLLCYFICVRVLIARGHCLFFVVCVVFLLPVFVCHCLYLLSLPNLCLCFCVLMAFGFLLFPLCVVCLLRCLFMSCLCRVCLVSVVFGMLSKFRFR